ncbi:RidA family protein [Komarekiella sp. 'clone 1']|uniref:RidA family protein n=1 Tax=Komarekiella delphini-convector SJRDD-AB1 TaxID=2593771 RepID=A0AA40VRP7_9NOST|nr:RidA family protein [Komarekiella delphini-convector]MBD6616531.1 RidA family protein [Komarekiella delphini-convector SJRDD-AB1]
MSIGIKFINPEGLYDPSMNGYTHVVSAPVGSTTVYISGQGGEDENGNLAIDDFASQLKQAFTNLRTALAGAGARPDEVVKITVLIVNHDESKLQLLTTEVQSMWSNQPPACTLIPVPRLALDAMLFEIEAIAVIATDVP